MAKSTFAYNLERPYPYKWFTPVVIVGGIIWTVLFSFLSLGSSGYSLVTELTHNPNITSSQGIFNQLPSFLASKPQASCEASIILANSNVMSNNSALIYTVSSIRAASQQLLPALTYYNNALENCSLISTTISMERAYGRTASQIASRAFGATVLGKLSCIAELADSGLTTIYLTVTWDPLPASVTTYELVGFVGRNKSTKASLYWGESLLMLNWLQLTSLVEEQDTGELSMFKSEATLSHSDITNDILSLEYYNASSRSSAFNLSAPWTTRPTPYYSGGDTDLLSLLVQDQDLWTSIDRLAKVFESTVYTDLGQIDLTTNILSNAILLQAFTLNFTRDWKEILGDGQGGSASQLKQLAQTDYDHQDQTIGTLGVVPAVFGATYICNVPQRKPMGELILAVVLADLVLLQALWTVFKLITGHMVRRKDSRADECEGCLSNGKDIPLVRSKIDSRSILVSRPSQASQESLPPPSSDTEHNAATHVRA